MEVKGTFDLLERSKEKYVIDDILAITRNKKWEKFSTNDLINNSYNVAYGLLELGFKPGDKIATITNNRPEWNFVDMGMALAGIIHIPVYPTINEKEFAYILNHSDARAVIVSDKPLVKKIKPIFKEISQLEFFYTFNKIDGENNWEKILELGKANADKHKDELEKIKAGIKEEDMATIIYTSGTTGTSKGVMLSHKNLMSNAISTSKIQPLVFGHKVLSFLPLSHVYERMLNYHYQYKGISIYYAENMATIIENLKEINADGFSSVPRLLEMVFDKIIAKGKDLKGVKKMIFFWAVNLGLRYELNGANGWFYEKQLEIANKLVFVKWREALGGKVQVIISGGSALQQRLARVFWAARINVQEGYGLTETSPVISVNGSEYPEIKFGTVGPVVDGVEVKIAEDGEILSKGANLMMGYYKDEKYTNEVIDSDGWFHTGDIGILEDGKYLKITDRKKEIFKNSAGKYIAPQVIENRIKESFFIAQSMVVGENEKFVSAIVSPNFSFLHDWCSRYKIHFHDNKELIKIPKVVARFQKEINDVNKNLSQVEQIKRFRLVCEDWTTASGELSPTLKLKRKFVATKYKAILEDIFSRSAENESLDEVINKAKGNQKKK